MADTSKDYIHEPLLQIMAANPQAFSKSEMLYAANRLLPGSMKSTKQFLAKYKGNILLELIQEHSDVPYYYIAPKFFVEILRAMPQEKFKAYAGCANPFVGYSYRVKWKVDDYVVRKFAESMYDFLHGNSYQSRACIVKLPDWAWQSYYRSYSSNLDNLSFYQYLDQLAELPELSVYFEYTDQSLKSWLFWLRRGRIVRNIPVNRQALENIFLTSTQMDSQKASEYFGFCYLYLVFAKDGNLQKALKDVTAPCPARTVLQAIDLIQKGKYGEAAKLFQHELRGTGNNVFGRDPLANFYYAIALRFDKTVASEKKANAILKKKDVTGLPYAAMRLILQSRMADKMTSQFTHPIAEIASINFNYLLAAFAMKHFHTMDAQAEADVDEYMRRASKEGYKLLEVEMANDFDFLKARQTELEKETGMHPSMPYIKVVPDWELVLNKLMDGDYIEKEKSNQEEPRERIAYLFSSDFYGIQPVLQKSKDGLTWTKGRNIALKRFYEGTGLPMTNQDRAVANLVEAYSYGWYGGTHYDLYGRKVVYALAGHPWVFDAGDPSIHIDIVLEKLQLSVTLKQDGYHVDSNVNKADLTEQYVVKEETPQLFKVLKLSDKQYLALQLLYTVKVFPVEAKDKLTKVLEAFSRNMVVMSDLLQNTNIKTVDADSRIVFRLQPSDDQVILQLLVRPFAKCPPYVQPGEGMDFVSTVYQGETLQTHRDMKAEGANLKRAMALLMPYEDEQDGNRWSLSIEECLDLLSMLRDHPDAGVVEWPEGARFRVNRGKLMPKDMHLTVSSMASWFDISGDIEIGEGEKMKIAQLMEKLREAKGHFIQLGDNEYVAVSDQLRRQLASLEKMGRSQKGKLRVAVYNAPALNDMEDSGVEINADDHYREFVERVEQSGDLKVRVPKNINAELRDYQKEGYVWMSRLAYWGAGALLADDMGLGKTLQTITVLLSRGKEGAALVIVPTSLILNWRDELARFAPGLKVRILNQAGEERAKTIEEADKFDVVITTYGLLINEEESLSKKEWNTIVLDEAHTIKNRDTKMSKAAMKLQGRFRILLTGTPVQNNLSEIWNLMQFANPELLGSFQQFTDRFITPVEKLHDKGAQQVLRRMIAPFILRRTKNDVLNELPQKTEVTRKVELSQEEWALYDHIRQQALLNLADGEATPLQTLTELTRLRQAACNAQLVDKKLKIPSSKQAAFLEMVDSLHDNHHRALVFSQFTSHLALIRKALDKKGVDYLYLDGATPAKERAQLVERFQTGDMPLFLISLKAGGLGLNLTAADYVIHLDPWWNPAIEEQASDRAYRIGQQNPVTVYRLIAEGTIEEKIIQLHKTKKSLADALLEGGDMSAKLSKDELLELLKER